MWFRQVPRCDRNEKEGSSQKVPESTSLLAKMFLCGFAFIMSLRCAARRASGRKEISVVTLTHGSGFAYARLHRGLTSHRAYGAWSMDGKCVVEQMRFHMFMKCVSGGRQVPRCAGIKRTGSSQKFPESTFLQLAAPGSFDSVVACAPTPLKMTEGKCIRYGTAEAMPLIPARAKTSFQLLPMQT